MQEWAAAIDEGMQRFSHLDNEVALFGKILRNEVDEGFWFEIQKVREIMIEAIREGIKKKGKIKKEGEIQKLVDAIENGDAEMEESLCKKVVRKFAQENEIKFIEQKIKETQNAKNRAQPAKPIEFKELQQILTEVLIIRHEKDLLKFFGLFKKFDTDGNGILNRAEYHQLTNEMKISHPEAEKLMNILDPYNIEQITFSECYEIFTKVNVWLN